MDRGFPVRVLQITIGDGSFGGVASFLLNYYSHIDHEKIHFDFLYCGENSMETKKNDPALAESKITTLHILKKNNNGVKEYLNLYPKLKEYLKQNQYDIIHVNSSNIFVNSCVASLIDDKTVYISHSHSSEPAIHFGSRTKQAGKIVIRFFLQKYIVRKADALYACSQEAGLFLFGEKGVQSDKFSVINNAIDTEKFKYDQNIRKQIRKYKNFIIGFVGRLSSEKNPEFAVDVFAEINKIIPESELWIVGSGNLENLIQKKIIDLNLQQKAFLLGQRNDVASLMQAFDVLIFPSKSEGFGLSAIEAQCSGLPVFASDNVPCAVDVTGLVTFLSLSDSVEMWAKKIIDMVGRKIERKDMSEIIKKQNFDIANASELLVRNYYKLLSKRHK